VTSESESARNIMFREILESELGEILLNPTDVVAERIVDTLWRKLIKSRLLTARLKFLIMVFGGFVKLCTVFNGN
jgi:hypothetical protein